jgi:transcriptional regulator with XRE-family HTH domain
MAGPSSIEVHRATTTVSGLVPVTGAGGGASGPQNPWETFGQYLRSQRQLAQLSLRQLADLTRISNPYLSQIERGLHQPSVTIIKTLANALGVSPEDLLAHAAGIDAQPGNEPNIEAVIRNDARLNESQKSAMLAVYRSMLGQEDAPPTE